jgi:hypothetical protein
MVAWARSGKERKVGGGACTWPSSFRAMLLGARRAGFVSRAVRLRQGWAQLVSCWALGGRAKRDFASEKVCRDGGREVNEAVVSVVVGLELGACVWSKRASWQRPCANACLSCVRGGGAVEVPGQGTLSPNKKAAQSSSPTTLHIHDHHHHKALQDKAEAHDARDNDIDASLRT